MVEREYSYGIYMFIDIQNGEVVYIGLDSHIDRRERIKAHYQQHTYDKQQFNRVLQNNPDRFKPFVYCEVKTREEMCQLEFDLINLYRPRFNYRHGGGGGYINTEFEYTVAKCGASNEGKQRYTILSMDSKKLIRSTDFEFLQDICLKLNKNELTPDEVKNIKRKTSLHEIMKNNETRNSTGFFRVSKRIDERLSQGYSWEYKYTNKNGKKKRFQRVDLFELEKVIKSRDLPWEIVDIQKATNTVKQFIGF